MIAIIRIAGKVKINKEVEETLLRLRLKTKYNCVLIDEKDKIKMGMLNKVRNHVAFGNIEKPTLIRLIEKRGQKIDKKKEINATKIAEELGKEKGIETKNMEKLNIKPVFRLHPPRHGLKSSKKQFPRGVLGDNKEISKLIERML